MPQVINSFRGGDTHMCMPPTCVHCHATTGPPKIGPPGPFMAATAGPPAQTICKTADGSPRPTMHGAVVGPPLPHLVPRHIIQRLLLFIEP